MRYSMIILSLCVVLLSSCLKSENNCTVEDFMGVWKGLAVCSGVEEQATISVFQNSDGTILTRYNGAVLPTSLTGCSISASGVTGFGTTKTDYSVNGSIENEMLTVTYVLVGPNTKTCQVSMTKQ